VKGVKKLGVRFGNWLTAEQGQALWQAPDEQRLKGKRDRALLALLLACGLRRHEAVTLTWDHLQQREDHWAIVDLVGKGGHIRTVPVPAWVRKEVNDWLIAAAIDRVSCSVVPPPKMMYLSFGMNWRERRLPGLGQPGAQLEGRTLWGHHCRQRL
jgi:site-specific recombinase XerD